MKIVGLSLTVGTKKILDKLSVNFFDGVVNHILGKNGIGKSCFAKACGGVLPYAGQIDVEGSDIAIIGSYTNIPSNLRLLDVMKIISNSRLSEELIKELRLGDIDQRKLIGKMSDGQKQKVKLMYFLSLKKQYLVLDEFTSALDKSSTAEVYDFLNLCVKKKGLTIINITHNLSDLEYMPGRYYIFDETGIKNVADKDAAIENYIKGV